MELNFSEIQEGLLAADRVTLARAITLIESTRDDHRELADRLIESILPHTGKSKRIGITGVPGVGKSTFIEAFGKLLVKNGHRVAVLAIDPSSSRSKGSILGDKTRMNELSLMPEVFIRPTPSGGALGGIAARTKETLLLCEAAGFDTILIETVGVGQSETEVYQLVDFFLLLMLSGAGDELQGIKRGIMEMADLIAITKADGENTEKAKLAAREYMNAMHLFPAHPGQWAPTATTCSAIEEKGLKEIYDLLNSYFDKTEKNGYFLHKRKEQDTWWFHETIKRELSYRFYRDDHIKAQLAISEKAVREGKSHPISEAMRLIKDWGD